MAPVKHPEHFELADLCLSEAKLLLDQDSPTVVKALQLMARKLQLPADQQYTSDIIVNNLRDQASRRASLLAHDIGKTPKSPDVAALWAKLISDLQAYRDEAT